MIVKRIPSNLKELNPKIEFFDMWYQKIPLEDLDYEETIYVRLKAGIDKNTLDLLKDLMSSPYPWEHSPEWELVEEEIRKKNDVILAECVELVDDIEGPEPEGKWMMVSTPATVTVLNKLLDGKISWEEILGERKEGIKAYNKNAALIDLSDIMHSRYRGQLREEIKYIKFSSIDDLVLFNLFSIRLWEQGVANNILDIIKVFDRDNNIFERSQDDFGRFWCRTITDRKYQLLEKISELTNELATIDNVAAKS
jgi:hypothetical protein